MNVRVASGNGALIGASFMIDLRRQRQISQGPNFLSGSARSSDVITGRFSSARSLLLSAIVLYNGGAVRISGPAAAADGQTDGRSRLSILIGETVPRRPARRGEARGPG